MCHPWLAAGVTCVLALVLVRELGPVVRGPAGGARAADTGLLGVRLRTWFRGWVEPVVDALLAAGLSANVVTALQLLASALCGLAFGAGWLFTAGWLLLSCGTLDVLDGGMARKRGAASPRGAFIDSVVDRYADGAVCAGLAVLYRDDWALWAVLAAFVGAFMVSYTRARAEGLGTECRVGLAQRPERYVLLAAGSIAGALGSHLACSPVPGRVLLTASVCVVAVLANATALQRAVFVLRRLS